MKLPGLTRPGQVQLQAAQNTCAAFSFLPTTVWYPLGMTESLSAPHHGRTTFPETRSSFHA
jgi:hypothetical protein